MNANNIYLSFSFLIYTIFKVNHFIYYIIKMIESFISKTKIFEGERYHVETVKTEREELKDDI